MRQAFVFAPALVLAGTVTMLASCASSNPQPTRGPAPVVTSWTPPPTAQVWTAPHEDALTVGPPVSHCSPAEWGPPVAVDRSDAPLSVQASAKGLSLDTAGASAGRVLIALATASKRAIDVQGDGAAVRIYARVREQPFDQLVKSVAHAAGLQVAVSEPDKPVSVHDARAARESERTSRVTKLGFAPLETRILPTKHSSALANVIAMTLLSCRGRVTSAPSLSIVVITDVAAVLDRSAELAASLEAAKPSRVEFEPIRAGALADWEKRAPRCAYIPQTPAPNGPGGKLSAEGTAAGELLRNIARAEGRDVIVGCGGDLPAYYASGPAPATAATAAAAIGLGQIDDTTWAASELALNYKLRAERRAHGPEKHELVTFTVAHARELAAAADDLVGDPSAAIAYEPASMLVVSATSSDIARIEKLLREWSK